MEEIILKVEGMHCSGCENRVKTALSQIDGIESVEASHEDGEVVITVSHEVDMAQVREEIEDLGFEVKE